MRRSKLELYEDILNALVNRALTVDSIAFACGTDCIALRKRLNFLMKSGVVEEKNYQEKTRYVLTRRGLAICETLALTKSLEKLQTNTRNINEDMQTIPTLSEHKAPKTKPRKRNEKY